MKILNYLPKIVTFGTYREKSLEWYVAEETDVYQVLLAKERITKMAFNKNLDNNYMESDVRKFLLNFETQEFNSKEREKLIAHEDLGDKVFLLSEDEANSLSYKLRICDSWWWLRSPYPSNYTYALTVCSDGSGNDAHTNHSGGGVRPAVIVKK